MEIWRLHKARFPVSSFYGANRDGGRYNSPGVPALYASCSASATILELRVHLDTPPGPGMLHKISRTEVDQTKLMTFSQVDIPGWNDSDLSYRRPRAFGNKLLADLEILGFLAPSFTSYGFDQTVVLNPNHPEFASLVWTSYDFEFDNRLW